MLPSADKYTNACYQPIVQLQIVPDEKLLDIVRRKQQKNMRNTDYVKSSEPIEKTISKDVIVSRSGRKVKPTLKYLDTIDTEVLKRPKQSKKVTNKRRKVSKMSTSTKSIEISKCGKISSEEKTISILNGSNLNASSSDMTNKNYGMDIFKVLKHSNQSMTMTIKRLKKDFKTCITTEYIKSIETILKPDDYFIGIPSGVVKSNKKHVKNNTKVSKCSKQSSIKKSKKDPDISIAKELIQSQSNDITTEIIPNLDIVSKIMSNKGISPSTDAKPKINFENNDNKKPKRSTNYIHKFKNKNSDICIAKVLDQSQSIDLTNEDMEDIEVNLPKISNGISPSTYAKPNINYEDNDNKISKHSINYIYNLKMKDSNICVAKALDESQIIDLTNEAVENLVVTLPVISNDPPSTDVKPSINYEYDDNKNSKHLRNSINKLKSNGSDIFFTKPLVESQSAAFSKEVMSNLEVTLPIISSDGISLEGIPPSADAKPNINYGDNDNKKSKRLTNYKHKLKIKDSDIFIAKAMDESQIIDLTNEAIENLVVNLPIISNDVPPSTHGKPNLNDKDNANKKLKCSRNSINKRKKIYSDISITKPLVESKYAGFSIEGMSNLEVTMPIISNDGISLEDIPHNTDGKPSINDEVDDKKKSKRSTNYNHKFKSNSLGISITKPLDTSQTIDLTNKAMKNLVDNLPIISNDIPLKTDGKPSINVEDDDKKKSKRSTNYNHKFKSNSLGISITKPLDTSQTIDLTNKAMKNLVDNLSIISNDINDEDDDKKKSKYSTNDIIRLKKNDSGFYTIKPLVESQSNFSNEAMSNLDVTLPITSEGILPIADGKPNINYEDNDKKKSKRSTNYNHKLKNNGSNICITKALDESQSANFANDAMSNPEISLPIISSGGIYPEGIPYSTDNKPNLKYLDYEKKKSKRSKNFNDSLKGLKICIPKELVESQYFHIVNEVIENADNKNANKISSEDVPSSSFKPTENYDKKVSKHPINLKKKSSNICVAKKLDESQSADFSNEAMSNLEFPPTIISNSGTSPEGISPSTDAKPIINYLDIDKEKSKHSKNYIHKLKMKDLGICVAKALDELQSIDLTNKAMELEVNLPTISNGNMSPEDTILGISPSTDAKPNINYEDNDNKKSKRYIHKLKRKGLSDICIAKTLDVSQSIDLTNEATELEVNLPTMSNDIPTNTDGKPNINDEDDDKKKSKCSTNNIIRLKKNDSGFYTTKPLVESQSAAFSDEVMSNLEVTLPIVSNGGISPEDKKKSSDIDNELDELQSIDIANEAMANLDANPTLISNEMSSEGSRLSLCIEKLEFFKTEFDFLTDISELHKSLQIDKTDLPVAINTLEKMNKSKIDVLTLKKYPTIVDTIQKVSVYVGVLKKPKGYLKKLERLHFNEQKEKIELIRGLAVELLCKLESLFTVPDEQTFQEVFNNAIRKFEYKVRHLTDNEIFGLWTDTSENNE